MPLHWICWNRARYPSRAGGASRRRHRRPDSRAAQAWAGGIGLRCTGCGLVSVSTAAAIGGDRRPTFGEADLGLGGKRPNIEIRESFVIARPQREVWAFLGDVERVVPCMPGATLTAARGNRLEGQLTIKLGPIAAAFNGEARIIRDEGMQHGMILGAGRDRLSASRASAEIAYRLSAEQGGAATRVDITLRALLLGPLAQFGRSAIVSDLAARLTDIFARNLERRLAGSSDTMEQSAAISAGSLLGAVILARLKHALTRLLGKFRR
jgi:carbon-monoxide dehydrogenase small subunit